MALGFRGSGPCLLGSKHLGQDSMQQEREVEESCLLHGQLEAERASQELVREITTIPCKDPPAVTFSSS